MKNLFLIIILFTFFSCSEKKEEIPSDVLPREKFVSVLIDMYMLEGKYSQANFVDRPTYDKGIAEYEKLFKQHSTDKKTVEKSFDYYTRQSVLMNAIYSEVLDSLNLKSKL